ncbi:hypothetical protein D3C81_1614840 [compost metagenome]
MRGINDARVTLTHRCVAEAEFLHAPGFEVLDEHVGGVDQLQHGVAPLRGVDVDGDALFVAVEGAKESGSGPQQTTCTVTAGWLDLDDFGTEVTEDHPAGRPHHHVRNFDDTNAVQWKSGHECFPRSDSSSAAGGWRVIEWQTGAGNAAIQGFVRQRGMQHVP